MFFSEGGRKKSAEIDGNVLGSKHRGDHPNKNTERPALGSLESKRFEKNPTRNFILNLSACGR
jgi:hypothetical protein